MPDWRRRGPDKPDSETIKFLAEDVDSLRMVGDHRDVGNTGMEISESIPFYWFYQSQTHERKRGSGQVVGHPTFRINELL